MMVDPFGTIVGIIDLLDKARKAYDKFKDVKDLPKAFGNDFWANRSCEKHLQRCQGQRHADSANGQDTECG